MINRKIVRAILASTALAGGCLAAPAWADSPHPNLDANGVDLTTGEFSLRLPVYAIGSGQAELPLVAYTGAVDNWSDINLNQTVSGGVTRVAISLGKSFDTFSSADGFAVSTRGTGATITMSGNSATYRTLQGVTITFANPNPQYFPGGSSAFCNDTTTNNCALLPSEIEGKSGLGVAYEWDVTPNCTDPQEPDTSGNCGEYWRLRSVSNGSYAITWAYVNETGSPVTAYFRKATATFSNANVSGTSPVVTYGYPSAGVTTLTTPGGKTWRITESGGVSGVRRPSASSDTTTITRSVSTGDVTAVTNNGITTNYSRSVSGSTATMVVTDALSNTTTVVSDMTKFRPTSVTDALSRTTSFTYDTLGRPTEITYPEGNKAQYTYDSRGNVTETRLKPKAGSALSDIVTTASYPSSCTTPSCNSPDSVTDARGNTTDYTYDATTGLPASVTAPAPTSGATRPQTRYSYATTGVAVLTGVSRCQVGAVGDTPSCVGTADEVKTTIAYDANLNPTSVTTAAGDASLSATTAYTYNIAGDLLTVDGPLSGGGDTSTFRYDADRRRLGSISADPDGAGARKRRAVKTTYNDDGQPTVVEAGMVNGTSDTDWAAFASSQQSTASYDADGRKTRNVQTAGGTTYGVTQYSYDALGRGACAARRMNPTYWGTATDACTAQTAGSYGPDRIVKASYDAAGQQTKVQTAYGITGTQADEATATYNANGTIASATDAESNKTSYTYDGVDRLVKTTYPATTKGAGTSNTSDYEQLGYDAGGNVSSRRLRDGNSIGYTYDALNRLTAKDLPGSEPDVAYTYDLMNRPLTAAISTQTVTLSWDALGRNTSQASALGTVAYQYDVAGRRTRLTWPDAFYVTYEYDPTGDLTAIKESGTTSLAAFAYDDLGRRTSLTRGNGVVSTYGYDAVSRLSSLTSDPAGTSYDLALGMSYNPAGQIAATTRSNNAYSWTGAVNVNRGYTSNGLNQFTASGSTSLGYDARGNLTSSGSDSYTYSSENLLLTGPGGASLSYDPLLRLSQASSDAAGTSQFVYDGTSIIAQANSAGAFNRRYVLVPGSDEVVAEYKPMSGTVNWKLLDERGSVIAAVDSAGNAGAPNTYDEYGIPGSTNAMRYQYTGQVWLGEVGLYYYKARLYSPTLGRFMQTDPIGYGDGMNWYNYVKGDPVNATDPSGLGGCDGHMGTVTGSRIPVCLANGYASADGRGDGTGPVVHFGGDSEGASHGGWVGCTNCSTTSDDGVDIVITGNTISFVSDAYFPRFNSYWPGRGNCAFGNNFCGPAPIAPPAEPAWQPPSTYLICSSPGMGGCTQVINNNTVVPTRAQVACNLSISAPFIPLGAPIEGGAVMIGAMNGSQQAAAAAGVGIAAYSVIDSCSDAISGK